MNAFRQLLQPPMLMSANSPRVPHQRVPLGTWISSASPLVAEAIGYAGFDWAVIDMEHSPLELGGVVALLQAFGAVKTVPVVRVPGNEPVIFKRVLDAGATTVMVPFVQSATEAMAAVAATRYPPDGIRGMAGVSRATHFGTLPNYARHANAGICVIAQIESAPALQRLEEIAAVDGIDALFIGPADLAASLGHLGESTHAEVRAAMGQAVARARIVGKPIGTLATTPEQAAHARAAGFDFVGLGTDLGLLVHAAQAALAALRSPDTAVVHTLAAGTHAY